MSILRTRARQPSLKDSHNKRNSSKQLINTTITFPFLTLPFEIRRLVLQHLLSSTPIAFCYIRLHGRLKLPTNSSCTISPQILQTSHQMYNEGWPILYGENVFSLTHTLALTSLTSPQVRMHVKKHAYECDQPTFWKHIRQLHITIRTSTRHRQASHRSILSNVHRIVEYILDDAAPLVSLCIEVLADENPLAENGSELNLTPGQLVRVLKPLTLLRISGIVKVDIEDKWVLKQIKNAITDIEHPVPNIYHLRDGICAKIKERTANGIYCKPDLRCVQECDVQKVERVHRDIMGS